MLSPSTDRKPTSPFPFPFPFLLAPLPGSHPALLPFFAGVLLCFGLSTLFHLQCCALAAVAVPLFCVRLGRITWRCVVVDCVAVLCFRAHLFHSVVQRSRGGQSGISQPRGVSCDFDFSAAGGNPGQCQVAGLSPARAFFSAITPDLQVAPKVQLPTVNISTVDPSSVDVTVPGHGGKGATRRRRTTTSTPATMRGWWRASSGHSRPRRRGGLPF